LGNIAKHSVVMADSIVTKDIPFVFSCGRRSCKDS